MMTTVEALPRTWHSVHVHLRRSRDDVDRYIGGQLASTLSAAASDGTVTDWFFIRYGEGGHHLRVRLRDLDGDGAALTRGLEAGLGADERLVSAHYEPETERYGGERALPVAEDVFGAASRLAVRLLRDRPTPQQRLAAGIELTMATAAALELAPEAAVRWLRINAYSWRWHAGAGSRPAGGLLHAAAEAAPARAAAITSRWAVIDAGRLSPGGLVAQWVDAVRRARAELETSGPLPWLGVWGSQLHMLCNRIGLVPDEERWICWFLAECLVGPDGAVGYFDDSLRAADRSYLAASRYRIGDMAARAPREDGARPRLVVGANPMAADEIDLPAGPAPSATLVQALATRTSARGQFAAMGADSLATLLWTALAPVAGAPRVQWGQRPEQVWQRRPHPSAGAQYTVRARLIAGRVDGLAPALYDVDEQRRRLTRISDAPAAEDLAAASMWFRDKPPFEDRVDAGSVPAVLALWLDLAALRGRYGQRALRFGLLEAGHVAQDLALVAAACGLALTTVGGFYDDVTAELLLLDGLDDVPVYLLPLGGRIGNPADPPATSYPSQFPQGGRR